MINLLIQSLEKRCAELPDSNSPDCRFISLEIPLDNSFPIATPDQQPHFFLKKSDAQHCLLGLGELLTITASGQQRFEKIKNQFQNLLQQWRQATTTLPIAFIAFAFDEDDPMSGDWQSLPNTLLQIPRVLIKQTATEKHLQVNLDLTKNTIKENIRAVHDLLTDYMSIHLKDIPPSLTVSDFQTGIKASNTPIEVQSQNQDRIQWHQLNQRALKEINQGSFDKLVTSRQQWVQLNHSVSLSALSNKLVQHYPACTILSFIGNGKKLVSASPEQLIHLQDRTIRSEAIGGTIQRSPVNEQTPPQLMPTDQDNPEYYKLLREHRFIAQDIYQRLDPLCHSLKMPCSPYLMKLHNMYHLETPVEGILQEKFDIFDIINALHPTPAIAGFPALQAREWLLKHEGYQRGWYTGAFGWIDGNLNGELSVMLRCALLDKTQAHLYAGAGLIKESDPDIEWQETELKMQTILEML